jgi:UDP-N-acetylglucosamine acyltransferase
MSSRVHSTAIVDPAAQLGVDVEIGPFCIVGPQVRLGDRTRLVSHVVIEGSTVVGDDCVIYPFAMLGAPPQHLAHKGEETRLEIGDRNQIREHATMHAGTVQGGGVTWVGSDGLFMVGTHVAHDCVVGDRVAMANNAALGGHVKVGDFVFVGGLAGVHQHTRIGRYSFVGASAMVTKDVIPYGSVWGNHAHLEGLNLVGLKRRGFSRETINDLRSAYRLMFGPEGTFQERLEDAARVYADRPEVREIVDFVRADANRPLCLPTLEW